MTEVETKGAGAPGFAEPPVWVQIGVLDGAASRHVRQVLARTAARGGSALVVDLAGLDDRHELTMFALIVETARQVAAGDGDLTVVNAPPRLATILTASDVLVLPAGQLPPKPNGTLTVTLGAGHLVGQTTVWGD